MRKLVLVAAMLMASASAHAGNFSFNVEGQKVQVAIPRGCSSLSCINITAPGLADKFKSKDEDTSTSTTAPATATAPQAAPTAPQAAPVAPAPATAVAPQAPTKVTLLPAPAADTNATNAPAPAVSAPEVAPQAAPVQAQVQAPVQVAAAPAAPVAAPAPAAVQTATSPIGLWMSEKKEGKVRIEDCNGNLCGYAVDAKTGANGEKVLINMKPRGNQWAGRIHDTRKGGTYDSTIALRGSDKLKVQGCMMMFCGGETWTRIE